MCLYYHTDGVISTYCDAGNDSVKLFAYVLIEQDVGKLQVLQIQGGKRQIKTKVNLNTKPEKILEFKMKVKAKSDQKYRL
jgi:hypothetical protein